MRRRPAPACLWFVVGLLALVAALVLVSCVRAFDGSVVYMTMSLPQYFRPVARGSHYELWATVRGSAIVRLQSFAIQPIIDSQSPCFIDEQGQLISAKVSETEFRRIRMLEAILAVTSYSASSGPKVPEGASPAQRKSVCDAFFAEPANADFYFGNYRQLTLPRAGVLFGIVDGLDPRSKTPIGGMSFVSDYRLAGLSALTVAAGRDDSPDLLGPILMQGTVTAPVREGRLIPVTLTNPDDAAIRGTAAVFVNLDDAGIEL
jgi:hypothetical protein